MPTPPRARRPAPRPLRRGFTLIEVLVAATVLTVGLLALAGTAGYLSRALTRGAAITRATREARSSLERVRARPCAAGAGAPGAPTPQFVEARAPLTHRVRVGGDSAITLRSAFPCPR